MFFIFNKIVIENIDNKIFICYNLKKNKNINTKINKIITRLIDIGGKRLSKKVNKKEEEIWRDIKNYEGSYQISNMGRVKV